MDGICIYNMRVVVVSSNLVLHAQFYQSIYPAPWRAMVCWMIKSDDF